jgi:hypothetical protein
MMNTRLMRAVLIAGLFTLCITGTAHAEYTGAEAYEYMQANDLPNIGEAIYQLKAQDMGANIVDALQATPTLRQCYAGVWFDTQASESIDDTHARYNVPLLGSTCRTPINTALQRLGLRQGVYGYAFVTARRSWADLQRLRDDVNEDLRTEIAAGEASTALDAKTNSVVVSTPTAQPGTASTTTTPGVRYEVDPGAFAQTTADPPANCSNTERGCGSPLRAGERMFRVAQCQTGPIFRRADGARYMLTAGHCLVANQGAGWDVYDPDYGGDRQIGVQSGPAHFGADGDWGAIRLTNNDLLNDGWGSGYWRWDEQVLHFWAGSAPSYQGMPACAGSQAVTGPHNCGVVKYLDRGFSDSKTGVEIHGLTDARSMCVWEGDSGGFVASDHMARGIISGSGACSTDPWWQRQYGRMFWQEVEPVRQTLGLLPLPTCLWYPGDI